MAGKNAAVFGLDSPKATFVVHLRPGILAYTTYEIWVSALDRGPFGRHFLLLATTAAALSVQRFKNTLIDD